VWGVSRCGRSFCSTSSSSNGIGIGVGTGLLLLLCVLDLLGMAHDGCNGVSTESRLVCLSLDGLGFGWGRGRGS